MVTRSLVIAMVTIAGFTAFGQAKQYVCTPCGSDCDKEIYDRPGTCRACGMTLVDRASATVFDLSLEEVCKRIAANPNLVLLDVRSEGEFKGSSVRNSYGHFRNAININIDDLEGRVSELSKFKDDEIVVYCSHSHRSPRATYFLSTKGFKNVKNMAGGVSTLSDDGKNECLKSTFVFH